MTAFGRCLSCDVYCISADAWRAHIAEKHTPKREQVCLMCERAYPAEQFAWHPCVAKVFSSNHPSNGGVA